MRACTSLYSVMLQACLWVFTLSIIGGGCAAGASTPSTDKEHSPRMCRFIIFKEATSGSTWFTDTINHLKTRKVGGKEVDKVVDLRGEFFNHYKDNLNQAEVIAAFDKVANVHCGMSSKLVGYTQNACHQRVSANDNWNFLRKYDVPVLGWLRSNIIHRAFGQLKLRSEIPGCPKHNTQSASAAEKCASGKYIVKPDELYWMIVHSTCENARIVHFVHEASNTSVPYFMTYEKFNQDQTLETRKMLEHLKVDTKAIDFGSLRSSYTKISSPDVSVQINNTAETMMWLEKWNSYVTEMDLVKMYQDTAYTDFQCDYHKACHQLLSAPEAATYHFSRDHARYCGEPPTIGSP